MIRPSADRERFRRFALIASILTVLGTGDCAWIAANADGSRLGEFLLGVMAGTFVVLGLLFFAIWRGRI